MMRLGKKLLALALSLALLVLPAAAMAEPMGAITLSLTDPVVYYNGELLKDMTGLTANLTLAGTQAVDQGTVQLQVLGGEQSALAAVLELSDGKVVFTADGMPDKYYVSMEDTADMTVGTSSLSPEDTAKLTAAITGLANGTLMQELTEKFGAFGQKVMESMVDEGTVTYAMPSGDREMSQVSFTVSAEDMDAMMNDILTTLDGNPEFSELMKTMAEIAGQEELAELSLTEVYKEQGLNQEVSGAIYGDEEDGSFAVEVVSNATTAENDEEARAEFRLTYEPSEDGMVVYSDLDLYTDDESTGSIYCWYIASGETYSVEIGVGQMDDEDEFIPSAQIMARVEPITLSGVDTMQLTLTASADDQEITLIAASYENDGDLGGTFSLTADQARITGTFEGKADDTGLTGKITITFANGGDEVVAEANVALTLSEIDTADAFIGADGAVDLMSLDEEAMGEFTNTLYALGINALTVLDSNVPGLSGIMNELMGSMAGSEN